MNMLDEVAQISNLKQDGLGKSRSAKTPNMACITNYVNTSTPPFLCPHRLKNFLRFTTVCKGKDIYASVLYMVENSLTTYCVLIKNRTKYRTLSNMSFVDQSNASLIKNSTQVCTKGVFTSRKVGEKLL
jgi:hypothetical protein